MEQTEIKPENVKKIIIALSVIVIGIFLYFSLQRIFHKNPYGPQTKIDNFNQYYSDAPDYIEEMTYNLLYAAILKTNLKEESIPHSGAMIRENSNTLNFIQEGKYYRGDFVVDVPSIQQSYRIKISWAIGNNNDSIASNYPSYISCLKSEEMIYPDFGCQNALEEEENQEEQFYDKYPLAAKLPIRIDYYVDGYGAQVKYNIYSHLTGEGENESFSVLIEDYTGGNYEPALERIRNLGFNPDDYEIEYKDLSEEYAAPGYAGD